MFSRVWKTPLNYNNETNGFGIHRPAWLTLWFTSNCEGGSSTAWLTGNKWPCQKNSWKSDNSFINHEIENNYLVTYLHIDIKVLRISRACITCTVCTPCAVSKCIDDKTIAYKI